MGGRGGGTWRWLLPLLSTSTFTLSPIPNTSINPPTPTPSPKNQNCRAHADIGDCPATRQRACVRAAAATAHNIQLGRGGERPDAVSAAAVSAVAAVVGLRQDLRVPHHRSRSSSTAAAGDGTERRGLCRSTLGATTCLHMRVRFFFSKQMNEL